MTMTMRLRVLLAMLLLSTAPLLAQRPPDGPRPSFPWWKSEPFKKELGLSVDQAARIDKIWEVTRVELRQEWDDLSRYEAKLSRAIQSDADEATLTRMIDRVETARMSANKTRSLMLVQMVKVLSPEQRTRFGALHEKWLQEHPVPPPPSERQRDRH